MMRLRRRSFLAADVMTLALAGEIDAIAPGSKRLPGNRQSRLLSRGLSVSVRSGGIVHTPLGYHTGSFRRSWRFYGQDRRHPSRWRAERNCFSTTICQQSR